jgi:hypothetical protein
LARIETFDCSLFLILAVALGLLPPQRWSHRTVTGGSLSHLTVKRPGPMMPSAARKTAKVSVNSIPLSATQNAPRCAVKLATSIMKIERRHGPAHGNACRQSQPTEELGDAGKDGPGHGKRQPELRIELRHARKPAAPEPAEELHRPVEEEDHSQHQAHQQQTEVEAG